MNLKNILNLKLFKSSKKMFTYFIVTMILIFAIFIASGQVVLGYTHAKDIQEQTANMQVSLKEWNTKADFINQQPYRPIHAAQLENVQADVMFALQNHKLELVEFKSINGTNPTQHVFELGFKGSYESTVNYLNSFHSRDALMSIIHMRMNQENGDITTVVRYIVYVK